MPNRHKVKIHYLLIVALICLSSLTVLAAENVTIIPLYTKKSLGGVEIVTTETGRVWMDRNLGARRSALATNDIFARGSYYQWGRSNDGHAVSNSTTTGTTSATNVPGYEDFITNGASPYDWRVPQNHNLWQGTNGTNNPCPTGFRLPTIAEFEAERVTWSSDDGKGAFLSSLRLVMAGYRYFQTGTLTSASGNLGKYWTSTSNSVTGYTFVVELRFDGISTYGDYRANGCSVRCIKD